MKEYELTVLFHPDLEMNLDPALDKVKKLIEANGGKFEKEEAHGKKRLAYKINGQEFAVYYYIDVSLPAEAPAKISSTLNISDEVIRYLLVRTDERRKKAVLEQKDEEETKETNEEKGE